jgi:hypothetical protein
MESIAELRSEQVWRMAWEDVQYGGPPARAGQIWFRGVFTLILAGLLVAWVIHSFAS